VLAGPVGREVAIELVEEDSAWTELPALAPC